LTEHLDPKILRFEKKKQAEIEGKAKSRQGYNAFRNYIELPKEDGQKQAFMPRSMDELAGEFMGNFPDMVRYNHKICNIVNDNNRPGWREMRFLEDSKDLETAINDMGWLRDFKSKDMLSVKWESFFRSLRNRITPVRTVSDYPTWPMGPGQIALSPPIAPAQTGALDAFIDFFNPLTPHDRLLMKALVATVAWSNGQGKRPLFVIAGAHDADKTIQIGKSTFAEMIQELFVSPGDLDVRDDAARFTINLMANAHKRVIRLDNVRSIFNSAIIERFVTSKYLQGHVFGVGNRMIENHVTFILTANEPNLTIDLASRSVVIRLARPLPGNSWLEENVKAWIEANREAVLADCAYVLTLPRGANDRECATRFPEWERTILHKLGDDIGAGIKLDQERLQDKSEEHAAFRDFIYSKIISYKIAIKNETDFILSPETFNIFISSEIVCSWYFEFSGLRYAHSRGSYGKVIKKQCVESGLFPHPGKLRVGSVNPRGFWFSKPIRKRATYGILHKRNEDPYAIFVK